VLQHPAAQVGQLARPELCGLVDQEVLGLGQ
jgi:hypothetical protein